MGKSKAETVLESDLSVNSPSNTHQLPDVIRLYRFVRRPLLKRRLSRRDVFTRDGNRCQYCLVVSNELTLDHILPRSRGGSNDWVNVVSACKRCNHRKAGRTPKEAGMLLRVIPSAPRPHPYAIFLTIIVKPTWLMFMPWVAEAKSSYKESLNRP